MNKKSLVNIFGAAGLSTLMAGCATTGGAPVLGVSNTPATGANGCIETQGVGAIVVGISRSSFNEKCADYNTGRELARSDRGDIATLGIKILRETSPVVDNAAREVNSGRGSAPRDSKAECEVVAVDQSSRRVSMDCNPS